MGKKARATRATAAPLAGNAAMGADGGLTLWVYLLSFAAVLYALFEVYGPALHGPFVFTIYIFRMQIRMPPLFHSGGG